MSNEHNDMAFTGFVEGHSPLDPSVPVKSMANFLHSREIFSNNPVNDAMIKAMNDSLALLGDQAAKDGAKDMGEALSYARDDYVFDSHAVENECLPVLRECLIFANEYMALGEQEREQVPQRMTRLAKALNAIADISNAIVNLGVISSVEDSLLDDPTQEELEEYFGTMEVNESFTDTFLAPHGISLALEPLFEIETLDPVWQKVRVPVMTLAHNEETIRVLVVPCATYTPNWFLVISKFRKIALEYMEEANIHIETIASKGYSNVFPEDPSVDEDDE